MLKVTDKINKGKYFITSEAVRVQHPDKVVDYICDNILAEILEQEKNIKGEFNPPHAGIEGLLIKGGIIISGEINTNANLDIDNIVRRSVKELGYNSNELGLDYHNMVVMNCLNKQSPDINVGVTKALETRVLNEGEGELIGAGDQGIMVGFATDETSYLLPLPILIASRLMEQLQNLSKFSDEGKEILGLDGKGQVTIAYDRETDKPLYIDTIVISNCHRPEVSNNELVKFIKEEVIDEVVKEFGFNSEGINNIFINPTGEWNSINSCSSSDVGVSGRKLIADTYGSTLGGGIGGGNMHGKDPSKTDASGCFMGRYIAKHIVKAGLAKKVHITLGYAIGVANPVSIYVNTFNTGVISDREIEQLISEVFDLTPNGIIAELNLYNSNIYKQLSLTNIFFNQNLPWEKVDYDKVNVLREKAGITD